MKQSRHAGTSKAGQGVRLRRFLAPLARGLLVLLAAAALALLTVQVYILSASSGRTGHDLQAVEELTADETVGAILVLGAAVLPDQTASPLLAERLDLAVLAYEAGISDRILVSGDHSTPYYNEVGVMRDYLLAQGIPSEAIAMDPGGLDTYDSIYRASDLLGLDSLLICTQSYHMHRALYLARELGVRSWGFAADNWSGSSMLIAQVRESFARVKAVIEAELTHPAPDSAAGIILP